MMDEKELWRNLAEEMVRGWDVDPTGSGFLIATDWRLPNDERIEIYVRSVGEREDLYLVTDGGNLFNFLFANGIDLNTDAAGMRALGKIAETYGIEIVDFQMVRGAGEGDLHRAVRMVLEAVKDASYLLWRNVGLDGFVH